MNTAPQHLAEAIERAKRVGWLDATFDIADREHLSREHTKALMDATKQAMEDGARVAFRARAARGGLRHVGNTGRV